ncbi:MAG: lytic transglycosylase domain-containing protein [Gemmatimonadetes bacterium]|nr:lytic transglycosylase domain-containing protein [Gemmatimonadota bacterium]NIS01870.1 lytic transglycosylase domain-containing protein [Gemmatimonadota bacterium]NIT67651.1 lytic transglycosylase domain-containing protein [Gemmatimonadota bacterium]NIU53525.1 transglycosylase SLT domain-containing protein [Gemmatimonadota bacterium]NIV24353.1 transglycosylase SLT domain-containing protein [Gemmatimonadota bacterium]
MRQLSNTSSTWATGAVPLKWPKGLWIAEVPFPVWALLVVAIALGGAVSLTGLPQAANPAAAQLSSELALLQAEARDLQSDLELKTLEVERLQLIHGYSSEYRIPADRAMMIYDIALAEGLNPGLAFNLVRVESGFKRTAVSSAGAIGYTQVRPSTAKWLDPTVETKDLFDAETNLHLGFRYLNYLLDEYNGDTRLALLAYNRGPGRVGNLMASGIDPANGYAKRVLGE